MHHPWWNGVWKKWSFHFLFKILNVQKQTCWQAFSSIHHGDDCTWSFCYNYVLCVLHMYPSNVNFTITSIIKLLCELKVSLVCCSRRIPISSIGDSLHDTLVVGLDREHFLATFWNSFIYKFVAPPACSNGQLYKGQQIKVQQVVLLCLDYNFYFLFLLWSPWIIPYCLAYAWGCRCNVREVWT